MACMQQPFFSLIALITPLMFYMLTRDQSLAVQELHTEAVYAPLHIYTTASSPRDTCLKSAYLRLREGAEAIWR